MRKRIITGAMALLTLLAAPLVLRAQEPATRGGVPAEVYYLMPSFAGGIIYFREPFRTPWLS